LEPFALPQERAAIHGETTSGRAAEVRSQLEALAKRGNKLDLDRAVLLTESKHNRYWEEEFDSFGDYTVSVAGLKERAAYNLVKIVEGSEALGIPLSRIEHLESSKLREIFSLNPEDFYVNQELQRNEPLHEHIARLLVEIDPAKTSPVLTQEEVKAQVKLLKGLTGENDLVPMTKAKVTASCKANVCEPAVELAKRNIGSTKRDNEGDAVEPSEGAAWEVIAQSYLADPNSYPEGKAPQQDEETSAEKELDYQA
jgi:hypothetical protein